MSARADDWNDFWKAIYWWTVSHDYSGAGRGGKGQPTPVHLMTLYCASTIDSTHQFEVNLPTTLTKSSTLKPKIAHKDKVIQLQLPINSYAWGGMTANPSIPMQGYRNGLMSNSRRQVIETFMAPSFSIPEDPSRSLLMNIVMWRRLVGYRYRGRRCTSEYKTKISSVAPVPRTKSSFMT